MTITAREILYMEYGYSRNFITHERLKIGKINKYVAFELSAGRSICSPGNLYGVSIVKYVPETKTTKRLHKVSKAFHSLSVAQIFINNLKEKDINDDIFQE